MRGQKTLEEEKKGEQEQINDLIIDALPESYRTYASMRTGCRGRASDKEKLSEAKDDSDDKKETGN